MEQMCVREWSHLMETGNLANELLAHSYKMAQQQQQRKKTACPIQMARTSLPLAAIYCVAILIFIIMLNCVLLCVCVSVLLVFFLLFCFYVVVIWSIRMISHSQIPWISFLFYGICKTDFQFNRPISKNVVLMRRERKWKNQRSKKWNFDKLHIKTNENGVSSRW